MIWPFSKSKKVKTMEIVLKNHDVAEKRLSAALESVRESRKLLFGEELLSKQREQDATNN